MENDNANSNSNDKRQQRTWWRQALPTGRQQESPSSPINREELLAKHLPSEQDRKALMGCLASVLNMMFAARLRKDKGDNISSNSAASVVKNHAIVASKSKDGSVNDGDGEEVVDVDDTATSTATTAVKFSISDPYDTNEDNTTIISSSNRSSSSSNTNSTTAQERASLHRTRSFQRELLNASAELLFLSPDHAAIFLPNLDIQCGTAAGTGTGTGADNRNDGVDDNANNNNNNNNNNAAMVEQELLLRPFLESLSSSEESFRCIALLMFRFLLLSSEERSSSSSKSKVDDQNIDSKSNKESKGGAVAPQRMNIVGYDARVRFAFKYLAVSVLSHWELKEHSSFLTPERANVQATRKFEALEDGIASRLSVLSRMMMQEEEEKKKRGKGKLAGMKQESTFSQHAVRGLKIGAAGEFLSSYIYIAEGICFYIVLRGFIYGDDAVAKGGRNSLFCERVALTLANASLPSYFRPRHHIMIGCEQGPTPN